MLLIKKFVFLFVVVVVLLINLIDQTLANIRCQKTVMTIVMRQCGNTGMRAKRNVDGITQEIAETGNLEQHNTAKRQLSPGTSATIMGLAAPIMTDVLASALTGRNSLPLRGGRFGGSLYPYPIPVGAPYPAIPPYFIPGFSAESRLSRGFLPQATGDDLGFDLTQEEIEELYNEIFDRITRSSKKTIEEIHQAFIEIAAKCCQNADLCEKEDKTIINCV